MTAAQVKTALPCAAEYGDYDSSNALKFAHYYAQVLTVRELQ